jgi:hypothetical protein
MAVEELRESIERLVRERQEGRSGSNATGQSSVPFCAHPVSETTVRAVARFLYPVARGATPVSEMLVGEVVALPPEFDLAADAEVCGYDRDVAAAIDARSRRGVNRADTHL